MGGTQSYHEVVLVALDLFLCHMERLKVGNGSAEDALNQIKEHRYAEQYKADSKKIVLIGSSFDEQARTIKEWKTEPLKN